MMKIIKRHTITENEFNIVEVKYEGNLHRRKSNKYQFDWQRVSGFSSFDDEWTPVWKSVGKEKSLEFELIYNRILREEKLERIC